MTGGRTGRPKADWQREILKIKDSKNSHISLSQLEEMTGTNRRNLARTLSRLVTSQREVLYDTQELYQAMRKKLEGGKT